MQTENMKITKDGFVWKVINKEQALRIWNANIKALELYVLHSDDAESLIESDEQFFDAIENKLYIGIEVGQIETDITKEIIENSGRGIICWSIKDFEGRANSINKEDGTEFDESKFPIALERMISRHDSCNGITWETVDFYLNEYCKK